MVGINEKFSNALACPAPGEPVHLMFEKEKMVFFGPVHGKSPQSAKLAHPGGGSKK
jgi:hypothetical protein